MTLDRRRFLALSAAAGLAAGASATTVGYAQDTTRTNAKIVIIGAGAAGTALSNRLVDRLEGAQITIVDPRKDHWYQPGFSLIAAGLKPAGYAVSRTSDWLPRGVKLVSEAVVAVDPETKRVTTDAGTQLDYDVLVLAPGLVLDNDAIEGFSLDVVGRNGVGALYAGPQYAAKTWEAAARFSETGGVGLFTRPATEMKCAGAPLKHTFLIDDIAERAGTTKRKIVYASPSDNLFSVLIVSEKVRMLFQHRGVEPAYRHVLKAIDVEKKVATFTTPDGDLQRDYDYIHVIQPQRAPSFVPESGLAWPDRWIGQGWAEVDPHTLRHRRYADIFAVGDVAGVPKGKTAASVKWQVPVVEDHLVAHLAGREGTARYDGYTSCPLITRVGRAMLVEFDYQNNLVPSFPGIIAPLEELWVSWLMKEVALKATYNAMLRGRA
ncbi:NAD(P)/FAD-dependent oxidoreductase [Acuticoccus mangrovi]|nr:FAD/NAD(P)-binding oxidoreductase [Acuticoccus mangrovi]